VALAVLALAALGAEVGAETAVWLSHARGFVDEIESWGNREPGKALAVTALVALAALALGILAGAAMIFARERRGRRRAQKALSEARELHRRLIEGARDGIVVATLDGRILDANPVFCELTGLRRDDVIGQATDVFLSSGEPGEPASGPGVAPARRRSGDLALGPDEVEFRTPAGPRVMAVRSCPYFDAGGAPGVMFVVRDVTADRHAVERLRGEGFIDELTQLYNRRGFVALVEHQLRVDRRAARGSVCLRIALEGLVDISHRHGHAAGEEAIAEAGQVLRDTFRASDVVARVGEDDFAVLAVEAPRERVEAIRRRLEEAVGARNARGARTWRLGFRVAAASAAPSDTISPLELLARAAGALTPEPLSRGALSV
jgi:diguanylate cyclase (GGDEF)-like protein/PAS domain S-box-containing protein